MSNHQFVFNTLGERPFRGFSVRDVFQPRGHISGRPVRCYRPDGFQKVFSVRKTIECEPPLEKLFGIATVAKKHVRYSRNY